MKKVAKYALLGLAAFLALGLVLHLIFGVIATLFGLLLPLILIVAVGFLFKVLVL